MNQDRDFDISERLYAPERELFNVTRVTIAEPHGPCGGVNGAVRFTDKLLTIVAGRENVLTFNEVVHNHKTNRRFEDRGLVVIRERTADGERDYSKLPRNSLYLSSAHGYDDRDIQEALARGCIVFITECPLVTKEKRRTIRAINSGKQVVYFGRKGHPEPRAVSSVVPRDKFHLVTNTQDLGDLRVEPDIEYVFLNQTTMSQRDTRELKAIALEIIPLVSIDTKEDGCYATDNRQEAVAALMGDNDALLVVGSGDISNNTENLAKVGKDVMKPVSIINGVEEIDWPAYQGGSGIEHLVLTSSASCDEGDFLEVVDAFESRGVQIVHQVPHTMENETEFPIPAYRQLPKLEGRYKNWPSPSI